MAQGPLLVKQCGPVNLFRMWELYISLIIAYSIYITLLHACIHKQKPYTWYQYNWRLHMWNRNCLPFRSAWLHHQLYSVLLIFIIQAKYPESDRGNLSICRLSCLDPLVFPIFCLLPYMIRTKLDKYLSLVIKVVSAFLVGDINLLF